MEHEIRIKQIGNSVCLFHNGEVVYSEDLYAEDYAWQMVRAKKDDLKKKLGIF
jgi:hypothetical protein